MKYPLLNDLYKLKKNKEPNSEPCGTPAKTGAHNEH